MSRRRYCRALANLTLLAALTGACSTQQRHATLAFFFEGVPPLEGHTPPPEIAPPPTPGEPPRGPIAAEPANPTPPTRAAPLPHQPYVERKCNACHAANFSQDMKGSTREVCSACHEKVLSPGTVQHWPAAKWMCSTCHRSHESPYGRLLDKPMVDLCADCHEPVDTERYVHFPVKRGRCLSCHTAHQSAQAGLLRLPGDALCLRCHEQRDMDALAAHANRGGQTCVACHDPHQSPNRGLVK
jgi:predicted CXXCH cytochrome family protein